MHPRILAGFTLVAVLGGASMAQAATHAAQPAKHKGNIVQPCDIPGTTTGCIVGINSSYQGNGILGASAGGFGVWASGTNSGTGLFAITDTGYGVHSVGTGPECIPFFGTVRRARPVSHGSQPAQRIARRDALGIGRATL
jgi:hypothetical protein